MNAPDSIREIKEYLTKNGFPDSVEAVIILGSGLSGFTASVRQSANIQYSEIPHFPVTSVVGHAGNLIYGFVEDLPVLIFSGRFHHYEGFPFSKTVLPVHIANAFQAKKMIISNAAGAVNPNFRVGDLMVIDDIFRLFHKVASAPSEKFQFSNYQIAQKTKQIATGINLDIQRGTYLYVKGPNYETKAEIRAFQRLGVDVVGMSTAPELIEASRLEIPATAISLVTNMAAGISPTKLDHSEVKIAAERRKEDFARLVIELIKKL